jgi:homocysteine S-methyltransferase
MHLESLLAGDSRILGDGSMYELLRRSPEIEFDPHIAHAGLIYDDKSKAVLERVFRAYIEVGVSRGLPTAVTTATWRASRARVEASDFAGRAVNQDNARFLLDLRDEYAACGAPLAIGGVIGPRGDAYKHGEAPGTDEAREFHAWQIDALADSGVDFLHAATLPALPEAIGIARAMAATGLPYFISFVVEKSGTLLDGSPLGEAIAAIDADVTGKPPLYSVNCVHPSVMLRALESNPGIGERIAFFAGNTSARSVDELDGLEELDTEDPAIFARANRRLLDRCNIRILAGCCGTSPAHMEAIAKEIFAP